MSITALVVGYGSIGERHANNLSELGHTVVVVEPYQTNKEKSSLKGYKTYSTKEEVPIENIDAVFICSPTSEHINDAIFFVYKNKHIFVEKPLSHNLNNVSTLVDVCKKNNLKLMCGANLLFDNSVKLVKILIDNNTLGKIYSVDYCFGHFLPTWHETWDYTKSYSCSESSGGILRDDVHALSLIQFLFGNIVESKGIIYNTHSLEVKADDIAKCVHKTNKDIIVSISQDYLNIDYTRNMSIIGEKGNIIWDFADNEVCLKTKSISEWRIFRTNPDRNQMYIDEIIYYINCIKNNIEPMTNGVCELKILEKIREESKST